MASQANTSIVRFTDGREVCLSYGVPVAAFIPADFSRYSDLTAADGSFVSGYIKTDRRFSVTTSRHANSYAGASAKVVPDAVFCALVAPLDCRR